MASAPAGTHVVGNETGVHTLQRWHGEITVYVPVAGEQGTSSVHYFRCTHDHETRDAAQVCENRMKALAWREGPTFAGSREWVSDVR